MEKAITLFITLVLLGFSFPGTERQNVWPLKKVTDTHREKWQWLQEMEVRWEGRPALLLF